MRRMRLLFLILLVTILAATPKGIAVTVAGNAAHGGSIVANVSSATTDDGDGVAAAADCCDNEIRAWHGAPHCPLDCGATLSAITAVIPDDGRERLFVIAFSAASGSRTGLFRPPIS
ncbi:hypothetical protein LCGC14_0084610 [marine sediment metagenome]|uniref:Uncharacterized protein n=2 Tax=root TaxID=1 RepID=A0A0F9VXA3_9ZZZZ